MPDTGVTYIDQTDLNNKRVLMRVDFNVSMNPNYTIADDARIRQSLVTIKALLHNNNKLILVSHLGRPKGRDKQFSLQVVADKLHEYLPDYKVTIVDDFLAENKSVFTNQQPNEILMLENIRFYPEEKKNDPEFSKKLASLADVFVNDAFGVSHRADASVVGVTQHLPSYGGLLLKREVEMISKVITNPAKPVVAILGGSKISTKLNLIGRLMEIADYLIVGGGIANTFAQAQGFEIGKSISEYDELENARRLLFMAAQKHTVICLPSDIVSGDPGNTTSGGEIKRITEMTKDSQILDIGPETQAIYGSIIGKAKTIVWNGPVGYFENPAYRRGTDFIYYVITQNADALSIVGGGDTLAAINKKEYLEKITHISTGGGAMLEFIENGSLPGIDALKK